TAGKRGRILVQEGFAAGRARASDPVQRRADQERDGIDAEIIYGILGISRGLLGGKGIGEHALLSAVYHAYNQYIAEFNQTMPGHYFGLGCLPNHDAQAAAEEVRYCASLGLKGATIVPWGAAMPMWHDTWEERLTDDCPLSMLPSEYFKRQIYATFQKDHHGVQSMARIAPDNVMWGSDYPHRDGTWPFSQKVIEAQFRDVDGAIARKML